MAEHLMIKLRLSHSISTPYKQIILLTLVLFLTPFFVYAEVLKDPTQPPASLDHNIANEAIPTGPVLQSVMLGANYQAAIISGQKVLLGKKYKEATLIKLNDHEAVLRYPDKSTVTLIMDYAVDKSVGESPTSKINTVKRTPKLK
ncbi:MAG: hypothetical protein Q7T58_06045 [Methylotenera sp.]|nr:hypothetical protein [Methylotenera sp.]